MYDSKKHIWGAAATILVFLGGQTCAAYYWGGKIEARLTSVEARLTVTENHLYELSRTLAPAARPPG